MLDTHCTEMSRRTCNKSIYSRTTLQQMADSPTFLARHDPSQQTHHHDGNSHQQMRQLQRGQDSNKSGEWVHATGFSSCTRLNKPQHRGGQSNDTWCTPGRGDATPETGVIQNEILQLGPCPLMLPCRAVQQAVFWVQALSRLAPGNCRAIV